MADHPLGPIIKVINNEAITQPDKSFVAKGAKVVTLDNRVIGKLDYPIGSVNHPYQVIKLFDNAPKELLGELVIAKLSRKNKKRRRKR